MVVKSCVAQAFRPIRKIAGKRFIAALIALKAVIVGATGAVIFHRKNGLWFVDFILIL